MRAVVCWLLLFVCCFFNLLVGVCCLFVVGYAVFVDCRCLSRVAFILLFDVRSSLLAVVCWLRVVCCA